MTPAKATALLPAFAILAVAGAIAFAIPFDRALGAITADNRLPRALALVTCGLAGLLLSSRIGATIGSRGLRRPFAAPLMIGAAVALLAALIDAVLPRSILVPGYIVYTTGTPLAIRVGVYCLRAFNEGVLYRLFLGGVFVWIFGRFWKASDGLPTTGAVIAGMALAQAINILVNVVAAPGSALTPAFLLYAAVRFVAPGVLWGWLYVRHGFVANEIAAVSAQLFLQPMIGLIYS